MQQTWAFPETYKEVILKTLDLSVYVLATPLVVRLVQPLIPGMTTAAAAVLSLTLVLVCLSFVPEEVTQLLTRTSGVNVLASVVLISLLRYVV